MFFYVFSSDVVRRCLRKKELFLSPEIEVKKPHKPRTSYAGHFLQTPTANTEAFVTIPLTTSKTKTAEYNPSKLLRKRASHIHIVSKKRTFVYPPWQRLTSPQQDRYCSPHRRSLVAAGPTQRSHRVPRLMRSCSTGFQKGSERWGWVLESFVQESQHCCSWEW